MVTGSNLNGTVTPRLGGSGVCTRLAAQDQITATELRIVCRPDELGTLQLAIVSNSSGETLKIHAETIEEPKVRFSVGTGATTREFEITLRAGLSGSIQRAWVDDFLYYVRSGFYDGTIFHSVNTGSVIEGGCYDTSLAQKRSASLAPVTPLVPQPLVVPMTNVAYSLSMSPTACGTGQLSAFALNLADNSSGKIVDLDARKYVAVGSYDGTDAAVRNAIYQISSLAPKGGTEQSLPNSPADRAAGTIRSLAQTR